jgi:transcriptional regulator with XRE-family HTH domain
MAMPATLEQIQRRAKPWVNASKTQAEEETPLRPELREIARHLNAVRTKLTEVSARDSGWRDEVIRMLSAFAAEASAELLGPTPFEVGLGGNVTSALSERLLLNSVSANASLSNAPENAAVTNNADIGLCGYLFAPGAIYSNASTVSCGYSFAPGAIYSMGDPASEAAFARHILSYRALRAPSGGEALVADRTHEGLRAFGDVKRWLDLSDEQTAEVAGLGRTTKYSWERGVVARASTIRLLIALREALEALVRTRGELHLRGWLSQVRQDGRTPLDVILAGDSEGFLTLLSEEVFSAPTGRARSEFKTLAPEPDLEAAPASRELRRRPRRNRRRGDQ